MTKYQNHGDARYESITDFLAAVRQAPRNAVNAGHYKSFMSGQHGPANWYGADCQDGHAVIKKMNDGWAQGRDRLNDLRSKIGEIDLVPVDRRRRPVRAATGDVLDIHSVYAGRLDIAWRSARRQTSQGPSKIDLCANMICSGGEHADVLFWRGAAAATLTDILESAGYMVRLVVGFGGGTMDENKYTSCRIIVKDHGMPFDVTSTSAVILPGFFRALGHAWIANHAPLKRGGGGISVGESVIEESETFISHNVRDHGTALAFVKDQIAKLNASIMGQAA